jgi:hypothetical protein
VSLDAGSRPQYPGLPASGRPRWRDLGPGLDQLEREIRAAERAGAATSLLVFYSGHGDVANGEGYVELEDARLTRSLLRRAILDRTAADEVHLVVDACRSYFLAFEKGPGGRRRAAAARQLVDRPRARTGYILSTSSDRESHEWEAFQGGIFSHEVRSGLRGAADADLDGRVTYAELGAFLTAANRGIRNPRFRPDFVVRPPGQLSDELLRWQGQARALLLDVPGQGHLVLEGPAGERVLDVNAAAGQELVLRLPLARPLFLRRADGDREVMIQEQATGEPLRLSALPGAPVRVASKGALHLAFAQLFSAPFGSVDVERYTRASRAAAAVEIEQTSDCCAPDRRGTARRIAGVTAIAAGAAGLGLAGWAVERSAAAGDASQVDRPGINQTVEDARLAAGLALGVAASAAILYWVLDEEDAEAPLPALTSAGDRGVAIGITSRW